MTPLITLSALPRVSKCAPSAVLPAVREASSAHRDLGTVRHAYLRDVSKMGQARALERVPEEYRLQCELIQLEGLPLGAEYEQEVAFAYSMESGEVRLLGFDINRDYKVAPDEIPGSLDVISGPAISDAVLVSDFKGDHDDSMDNASLNLQLRGQAVMAAKHRGVSRAIVEFIHLRDDGSHWVDRAEMDALDLQVAETDMRRAWQAAQREAMARATQGASYAPSVTRGAHCRWCPAYVSCPGTLATARLLTSAAGENVTVITKESAAKLYGQVREAERLVRLAKAELRAFAEVEAIELPDGSRYGKVEREKINSAAATGVLMRLYGEDVARAAGRFSTSKDAISKALKPLATERGVPLSRLAKETWEEMRAAGAFRMESVVEEYGGQKA
jgi:hypothetical protein